MINKKSILNIVLIFIIATICFAYGISVASSEVKITDSLGSLLPTADSCGPHGTKSGEVCLCDYHFQGPACDQCVAGYAGENCNQCDTKAGFEMAPNKTATCMPARSQILASLR